MHVRELCPAEPHFPHFLFLGGGGGSGVSSSPERQGDGSGVPGAELTGFGDSGNGHTMSLF